MMYDFVHVSEEIVTLVCVCFRCMEQEILISIMGDTDTTGKGREKM